MKKIFVKPLFSYFLLVIILSQSNTIAQDADSSSYPPSYNQKVQALNFKNIDMKDLLRGLALEYKTNIVIENKINQKISVALFDINLYKAVEMIANDNGLTFSFDSNRFYVKTPEEKRAPIRKDSKPFVNYHKEDDKIDLILDDVLLSNFVQKLRKETELNFLISNGSSGRITGTLTNVNMEVGLRNMLQNNGFYMHIVDSIYYITRSAYYSSDKSSQQNNSQYWVSVNRDKVTLDVRDGDVDKVIEDIVIQSDLQMIKLTTATAKVTVKCNSVPIEKALYYILKNTNYSYKMDGDVFISRATLTTAGSKIATAPILFMKADMTPTVSIIRIIKRT